MRATSLVHAASPRHPKIRTSRSTKLARPSQDCKSTVISGRRIFPLLQVSVLAPKVLYNLLVCISTPVGGALSVCIPNQHNTAARRAAFAGVDGTGTRGGGGGGQGASRSREFLG